MQINASNPYSIAPGTSQSPIRPEADLSFEESNNLVDNTIDRVNDARDTQQARNDAVREGAADLTAIRQQQQNLETYIEASSGEEVDSSPTALSATDLLEAQETLQRREALVFISENRDEQTQAQRLEDQIRESIGNRPEIQPVVDVRV